MIAQVGYENFCLGEKDLSCYVLHYLGTANLKHDISNKTLASQADFWADNT